MRYRPTRTLHYDYSLFNVDSKLIDRVAFRAQSGRTTRVWIQLHDGTQQLFHNLRSERVFDMLESNDPDADYRRLVGWVAPEKDLVDLPKRGMPCGPAMRERTYQGHFKDRAPIHIVPSPCSLEF